MPSALNLLIASDQSCDQWPSDGCLTSWQPDVALSHEHLAQDVDRTAPVALSRFCSPRG